MGFAGAQPILRGPAERKYLAGRNQLKPADVSVYLMHQANANLIRKVATALAIPPRAFRGLATSAGRLVATL